MWTCQYWMTQLSNKYTSHHRHSRSHPKHNLSIWPEIMNIDPSRCANVQITSQQDADGLNGCGTVTGDVLISGSAAGQITLNGVPNISGSLQLAPCPSTACNGLQSFFSPDLLEVGENVIFENLTTFTEIVLPKLQSARSISLVDLPNLTNVSMDSLHLAMNVGFELYNTGNVTLSGLASLAELSLSNLAVAKVVQLNDLPALKTISFKSLTSVNSIIILDPPLLSRADFQVMSAFRPSPDIPETQVQISNTNLTGLADIFAGAHNISRMSFSNNPSMYQLSLGILHIGELQVHGSGGLFLDFVEPLQYSESDISSVGLLNITGLRDVSSSRGPYNINSGLAMDTFIAANNNMTEMSVPAIQALKVLEIHDNANLENLGISADMTSWKMDVIRIVDNPKLVLGNDSLSSSSSMWTWPSGNISEMVFRGQLETSFL